MSLAFSDVGVRPSHIPPFTKKICVHANFLYTSSINPLKKSCTKVFMINSRTRSIPEEIMHQSVHDNAIYTEPD